MYSVTESNVHSVMGQLGVNTISPTEQEKGIKNLSLD